MTTLINSSQGWGRIQVDSTSQISLQRYQGAFLPMKIAGHWEAAPISSSGVNLSNAGLTAATLYYIYAYDNGGTLTLEASTTGHLTDADTGTEIKNGDATRTLVGMVYMDAGTPGTFVDSTTKAWCINWFNRRNGEIWNTFSASRTTTSTSWTEINSEIRTQFLTWGDEAIRATITGTANNNSAGQATLTAIGFDSASAPSAPSSYTQPGGGNNRGPIACAYASTLPEGLRFLTLLGAVSGGTGDWSNSTTIGSGIAVTVLSAMMRF